MNYFIDGLKHYAYFDGRATRKQFWLYYLWLIIFAIATSVFDVLLGTDDLIGDSGLISGIFLLATLLPTLGLKIRRLHDTGRSGYWILLNILFVIGSVILLIMLCKRSDPGPNKYGPPAGYTPAWNTPDYNNAANTVNFDSTDSTPIYERVKDSHDFTGPEE
jgi:uncharacterized membrane protein YhaH (DUF805 family)